MLDVVALAVRKVGTLAAGVQFTGEVVPQVFPPVVLANGGVRTQRALKHSAHTHTNVRVGTCHPPRVSSAPPFYLWSSPSLLWCFRWAM